MKLYKKLIIWVKVTGQNITGPTEVWSQNTDKHQTVTLSLANIRQLLYHNVK